MGEKWMDRLDLPEEPMPTETLLEIAGYRRVLIEHHCGVIQYGCNLVCVKVKFGTISISGEKLELTRMTRQQLIISGCIESVRLERRKS